tara:strand:- start:3031 stop:3345 length:315 start_codon:yes stop_codon:yes gene_type:complete
MKNTVIITSQYQENYGAHDWDGNGDCPQHWKNKGSHLFSIELDIDLLMYCQDADEVLTQMCAAHNSDHERFIYMEHEVQWNKPTPLGSTEDFLKINSRLSETIA